MGACCSGEESKKIVEEESTEIEQKVADAIEATKEIAEAAQKKAAEVAVAVQDEVAAIAEAAKEISEGAAEKVAHIDQAAQKEVAEAAEAEVAAIVLAAEGKGAEVAKAAEANVAPIAEAAQKEVAEVAVVAVVAAAKEGTEAACATMDAAVAAVTGVMIVEFMAEKGALKKVDFKTKNVGFEIAMAGGGCCGPAGQAQVAVNKVDKKGQAETLGVKRGWRVKSINGTQVTSLNPSQKLLEESIAKLPKA